MPSYQDLEDALDSLETYVSAQIPIITRSLQRLTDDLRRFGPPEMPPLPEIPSFPLFASVPPPPPPQPQVAPIVPMSYTESLVRWTGRHKYTLLGAGAVGLGVVAARYGYLGRNRFVGAATMTKKAEGKEVVVVLGADSHWGPLVVSELRSQGFIVIASVSSPDLVPELERIDKGYVVALVLDPYDPLSTTPFMRSLQSTLSMKFPLAPGDPYRTPSPAEVPALVSLVSLLSLTTPPSATPGSSMATISHPPHAISTLSISKDYLPHLVATHLTPLTIIQSVLPLFRVTRKKGGSRTSIVVALPGGPAAAGLVGQDASPALSSAAMGKSSEILRRELAITPELRGTKVVIIDVGELSLNRAEHHHRRRASSGHCARRPVDAKKFSEAILRAVAGPSIRYQTAVQDRTFALFVHGLGLTVRDWWRGDRFSIGSGAAVYSLASFLPTRIFDWFMLLPERLIAYRDTIRRKARHARREAQERKRERHGAQRPTDVDTTGKEVAVVPKQPPSLAASTISLAPESSDAGSSLPSPLSSPSLSQAGGSEADVDSAPSSEDGDVHQERIAESWVMDVDAGAEEGRTD